MHGIAGTSSDVLFSAAMLIVYLCLIKRNITPTFSAYIAVIKKLSLEAAAAAFIPSVFSWFYNTFPFWAFINPNQTWKTEIILTF